MPVKVTSAPTSGRPRLSLSASAAASNGSCCRRMVAVISPSRHRREKGDLAGTGNCGIGLDMGAVDRGADHLRVLEGIGVFLAAPGEPSHQIADSRNPCRKVDFLLRLADALTHPRKIHELHGECPVSEVRRPWWRSSLIT